MSGNSGGAAASIIIVAALGALFLGMLYFLIKISKIWKITLIERVLKAIKKRRNTQDSFRNDYGYSWDFFMAFRVYDEDDSLSPAQRTFSLQTVLDQLSKGGLEFRLFYSLNKKEVFAKIRCPLNKLQRQADLIDYKFQFDSTKLKELCEKGRDGLWDGLKLPEKSELTNYNAYDYIFGKYEFDSDQNCTSESVVEVYKRWPRVSLDEITREYNILGGTQSFVNTDNPLVSNDIPPEEPSNDEVLDETGRKIDLKDEAMIFRGVDRMKLIHNIITYRGIGGCGLDIHQLLKDECILAYGPLHDMVELRELEASWITLFDWPWNQPCEEIKNYFGEKIGLYFKWLGIYTSWLIPASVVGFFIWINIATDENNPSAPAVPYFAGFMGLWSALFLESWKRTEKVTAMKWGMVGFEEEEEDRPQFQGMKVLSPITGKTTTYFSPISRFFRNILSQTVICILLLFVIGVIAVIFAIRIAISDSGFIIAGVDMASVIASILLSVQIQILNYFFGEIALQLNNQENHRTDTEYEDSLISKTFAFQFVNSFASLFYIGFIKPFIPSIDPCVNNGDCMLELQMTLSTIFLTRLALGNIMELGIPLIKAFADERSRKAEHAKNVASQQQRASEFARKNQQSREGIELNGVLGNSEEDIIAKQENENSKFELSEIERMFTLEEYHVMLGTFEDYAEMAIQFGYTTMFIAAFPLATVLSLVNNYVEIRVDGWKLCHLFRRPEPRSCEDIGTWYTILELVSISSIFINSALVAFTGSNTVNYTWSERIWVFILMSSGLFAIRLFVAYLIPDVPEAVNIQLDRQEYIVGKVMYNIEDEDDSDLGKNNFIVPSYLVQPTDDDPM